MAFTRFSYDRARVEKDLQQSTDVGRWTINKPGLRDDHCYMDDPYIRLQGWGANIMHNSVDIQSDLLGLTRKLNRDHISENSHINKSAPMEKKNYKKCHMYTQQSLATNPGWLYKDLEQNNFQYLHLNPQENLFFKFENNLDTTLLERDNYVENECKK